MDLRRRLACLLACALGACATGSAGSKPATPESPPRLEYEPAEPDGVTGLPSPCGLTIVGNAGELHFRMELAGGRVGVRHDAGTDAFVVDGLVVKVTTMASNQISPAARDLVGIDLLRKHAEFESARLSETLGRDVKPEEIEILASDTMPSGLLWWSPGAAAAQAPTDVQPAGFDGTDAAQAAAPANPADSHAVEPERPTGIAYLTAAYGRRVLVLSVQGLRGEPQSTLVAKAKAWIASLTTASRRISVRHVRAEIQAAEAAGQTCPGRPNAIVEPQPAVEVKPASAAPAPRTP